MPKTSARRNYRGVSFAPRRPFEKERIDQELKLCGEYGLRCKREIWRSQLVLAKTRAVARKLLTLGDKDPQRIFEGEALLRRMHQWGLMAEDENKLDMVLSLNTQKLLERRLQSKVFKKGMAKSVHHARVLIVQRHVRVGQQMVNVPSFAVRPSSEKHIAYSFTSPFGNGRRGRTFRKRAKNASGGDGANEEADE